MIKSRTNEFYGSNDEIITKMNESKSILEKIESFFWRGGMQAGRPQNK